MKLLIVEDEEKIANSLKKGFEKEKFNIDLAFDGEKGLNLSTDQIYDCIILDLMLPKMNGIEVLKHIRQQKNYCPVIVLTAKDATEDKINGLNIGADDYLAKPFSFEELLARINALIRRATNSDNILKVNNLELNPFTHEVKRKGSAITLSAKEFSLLEYLMRHSGAILSETQIISNVWDSNYDGLSNVVAVFIKNLRNKIDRQFLNEKQLIKTVRGLGYQIEKDV